MCVKPAKKKQQSQELLVDFVFRRLYPRLYSEQLHLLFQRRFPRYASLCSLLYTGVRRRMLPIRVPSARAPQHSSRRAARGALRGALRWSIADDPRAHTRRCAGAPPALALRQETGGSGAQDVWTVFGWPGRWSQFFCISFVQIELDFIVLQISWESSSSIDDGFSFLLCSVPFPWPLDIRNPSFTLLGSPCMYVVI